VAVLDQPSFVAEARSQEHSRFFTSQIGQVEEVFQINGERPPRRLAERVALAHGGVAVAHARSLVLPRRR
jgi:hypothetical protein